jgi:hypothetical protein
LIVDVVNNLTQTDSRFFSVLLILLVNVLIYSLVVLSFFSS